MTADEDLDQRARRGRDADAKRKLHAAAGAREEARLPNALAAYRQWRAQLVPSLLTPTSLLSLSPAGTVALGVPVLLVPATMLVASIGLTHFAAWAGSVPLWILIATYIVARRYPPQSVASLRICLYVGVGATLLFLGAGTWLTKLVPGAPNWAMPWLGAAWLVNAIALVVLLLARARDIAFRRALPFAVDGYELLLSTECTHARLRLTFEQEAPPAATLRDLLGLSREAMRIETEGARSFELVVETKKRSTLGHNRWLHRWFRPFANQVLLPLHARHAIEGVGFET